ncbi:hypothetical protein AVEN_185358-1 [Araneus ventricosus]|uniref:RNase H type-1 domain-containing protein n=1 Tax=Araneus ventricosus TaxID=182803 RepID=A0A4Y2HRA1_ARAVE|nr:hypothetical protein AVEN_185358-1 [Araneus ventricosus]
MKGAGISSISLLGEEMRLNELNDSTRRHGLPGEIHKERAWITERVMLIDFERIDRLGLPWSANVFGISLWNSIRCAITRETVAHFATAALQLIEGIIPLHIKAKQEAAYVRTARLRKTSNYNNINFNPNNYEDGTVSTKFHPAIFQLEDRISLKKQFFPGLNIYTDGSKMEGKTGSAFCVMEEDTKKYEWMAQLSPFNAIFQAELLAIQGACLWTGKTNQQIKVWSDSESSLHSIASVDTRIPIAQQTQGILLKSTNIKLEWIRAHVGYSGNEAADVLAKKATQEGNPTYIPAPRNHIKGLLQKESIIH